MRQEIIQLMKETAETTECALIEEINTDTALLETGLDSMGFAILVARLEEEFGYDPFTLMDEPFYPRTFGEFVDIYQKYKPK